MRLRRRIRRRRKEKRRIRFRRRIRRGGLVNIEGMNIEDKKKSK